MVFNRFWRIGESRKGFVTLEDGGNIGDMEMIWVRKEIFMGMWSKLK